MCRNAKPRTTHRHARAGGNWTGPLGGVAWRPAGPSPQLSRRLTDALRRPRAPTADAPPAPPPTCRLDRPNPWNDGAVELDGTGQEGRRRSREMTQVCAAGTSTCWSAGGCRRTAKQAAARRRRSQ